MNLFHSPSLSELSALIGECNNYKNYFHLVVEHDGEVLLKRNSKKIKVLLPKFKFHISGLHGSAYVGTHAANNLTYLNQLYKNLLYCWENEVTGSVDYDKISNIQNINHWLEMNNISQPAEETDIVSTFFNKDVYTRHQATA